MHELFCGFYSFFLIFFIIIFLIFKKKIWNGKISKVKIFKDQLWVLLAQWSYLAAAVPRVVEEGEVGDGVELEAFGNRL